MTHMMNGMPPVSPRRPETTPRATPMICLIQCRVSRRRSWGGSSSSSSSVGAVLRGLLLRQEIPFTCCTKQSKDASKRPSGPMSPCHMLQVSLPSRGPLQQALQGDSLRQKQQQ